MRKIYPRKARQLMWRFAILGACIELFTFLIFPLAENSSIQFLGWIIVALAAIGGIMLLVGLIISLLFLRCPYCGAWLDKNGIHKPFCPHCGKNMDEFEESEIKTR